MNGGGEGLADARPARHISLKRGFANVGAALLLLVSGGWYAHIGVAGTFGALTFSGRVVGAVVLVILGGSISAGLLAGFALARRTLSPGTVKVIGGAALALAAALIFAFAIKARLPFPNVKSLAGGLSIGCCCHGAASFTATSTSRRRSRRC